MDKRLSKYLQLLYIHCHLYAFRVFVTIIIVNAIMHENETNKVQISVQGQIFTQSCRLSK